MCAVTIGAMPRLAWFTPVPPSRSGIAAYSEEILPILATRFQLDVFTTPLEPGQPRPEGHPPVFEAHDFAWKHFTSPYDLVVYQLGNAMCHDFMWPHLFRHPGLVVLHDAQLHHSRARQMLAHGRGDDYRAEFRANHPDAPGDGPELVIGDLADSLYYFWPMLRLVLQSARHVAVHAPRLADTLSDEYGIEVDTVRMGVADPRARTSSPTERDDPIEADQERRRMLRARYGLARRPGRVRGTRTRHPGETHLASPERPAAASSGPRPLLTCSSSAARRTTTTHWRRRGRWRWTPT